MKTKKQIALYLFVSVVLAATSVLAACSQPAPSPSPTPAPKPTTAAPAPAPSPTPSPSPTAKASPTPTPTAKPSPAPTPVFTPKLPDKLMFATYELGNTAYVIAAAFSQAFKKAYGTTVRTLPVGTGTSRVLAITSGRADVGFLSTEGYFAYEASHDFNTPEWGPTQLLGIKYIPWVTGVSVRADGKIKSVYDLKGTRTSFEPGSPALYIRAESILAFANLKKDDVTWVNFNTRNDAIDGLIAGKIDWLVSTQPSMPAMYKMEASPGGLRWADLPPDDKEGWKRLQKVMWSEPGNLLPGAGVKEGQVLHGLAYPYPNMDTIPGRMSDEAVYALLKAIDDTYDLYKDAFQWPWLWQIKNSASLPSEVPYHPGAIRYLKDKGFWTPLHETMQQEKLKHGEALRAAWEKVLGEAQEKNIKAADYAKYWEQRRLELFK